MIKLYDLDVSGNCYKVRLLLSMLKLDYEQIPVNLAAGEHLTEKFKALNPRSEIPVLADETVVVWDSHAILAYLVRRSGDDAWLPTDPQGAAQVHQWLAVAAHEIQYGLAAARACLKFGRKGDIKALQQRGITALQLLNSQLSRSLWLAGEHLTLADIACYPYVHCADEAEISLQPYARVRRWLQSVQAVEGYVPMFARTQNVA